jgi:hypothetical protein
MNHAETEIETGLWSVLGWWKGSSLSADNDVAIITPKCHIVAIRRTDGQITKWTKQTPPQHTGAASQGPQHTGAASQGDNTDGTREQ